MVKDEGDSLFSGPASPGSNPAGGPEPLAARMRPRSLDEFAGQEHIVGPGRLLRRAIQKDQLSSLIFSGPPGTGKTTLARVIANSTSSRFVTLNAVLAGIADIRAAVEEAKRHRELYDRRTILFVDEVHRWNKAQQDALLPWVENGTIVLIGATTENPFFEVNRALVSRSRVFQLRALGEADLKEVARAALADRDRGYGRWRVQFEEGALDHLVKTSDGDARSLLNALELAVETSAEPWPPAEGETVSVSARAAEESIQRRAVLYDKDGDYHYDAASAFIKSLRGSDPDASLYWLARMVYAGEDPRFIMRRMLISAAEDIGLADPNAIRVVSSCAEAFERIGMPEGQFHLAEAALYLSTAPKSNSSLGFFDALSAVEKESAEVPNHLKDGNRDKQGFGHGEGYLYPHAFRDHWVAQEYLPSSLKGRVFYHPGPLGLEGERRATVLERREAQVACLFSEGMDLEPGARGEDGLVWSAAGEARAEWKSRAESSAPARLAIARRVLFDRARPLRHDRVLVIEPRFPYLVWEALRACPEGTVVVLVKGERERAIIEQYATTLSELERPIVLEGTVDSLESEKILAGAGFSDFDLIAGRDILAASADPAAAIRGLGAKFPGAKLALVESLVREGGRLSMLPLERYLDEPLKARFSAFETDFYGKAAPVALGMSRGEIEDALRESGIPCLATELVTESYERRFSREELAAWLRPESAYGKAASLSFTPEELARIGAAAVESTRELPSRWPYSLLYVSALFQSPSAGLDT